MKEFKIVSAKNVALLEKELAKFFASGFVLFGQLVYTPDDGLVQMLMRDIKQEQPKEQPEEPIED